MACIGRCGIYETRPQFCKDYPRVTDFIPEGCTFYFIGAERRGECQPEVCQERCCCAYPREGGEPLARPLDSMAGGLPCKHLKWVETVEKVADADEVPSSNSELATQVVKLLKEA